MKAFVDKDVCIGCGACAGICSEVFDMDSDGLAVAIEGEVSTDLEESAVDARESCPVDAITVD